MNFSLSISYLRMIYLYLVPIGLIFERRDSSENSALQGLATQVWIRKYQNLEEYSPLKTFWEWIARQVLCHRLFLRQWGELKIVGHAYY